MYYELYIDVLFLENLVLDYLLLRLVGRLGNYRTTQPRMWLAAGMGSVSFCILCWFSLLWTVPGMLVAHILLGALMVKTGLRPGKWRRLLSATAMLYVCSVLLGGIVAWLREIFPSRSWPLWLLAVLILALLEPVVRRLFSFRKQRKVLCETVLYYGGVCRHATGLWDTGNSLYDPLHGKPVSIVERRLLEPEVSAEELLFQLPYHSIGRKDGMIPALIADYLCIRTEDGELLVERPVLGLTEEPLSSDGSYDLILNPDLTEKSSPLGLRRGNVELEMEERKC